jgi:hypothetical protein
MLDDAIEAAGGTGWRQYLADYASGSETIRRQAMMGVAARQLRQNPNAFANTVEGDAPDVVSGVFGGNRIDLRNLMNPTGVGPSGMDALAGAARQIQRDERIGVLAGEGRGVARELLQQAGGGGRIRGVATLVGRVLRPGTAAAMDVGSALLDAKIAPFGVIARRITSAAANEGYQLKLRETQAVPLTANATLGVGTINSIDTNGAAITTLNLPAIGTGDTLLEDGDFVVIRDVRGALETNNCTINGNGKSIRFMDQGTDTTLVMNDNFVEIWCVWDGSADLWLATAIWKA